ncbi:MAG: protease HtpX [Gammaproteobacteria bacterium]|jgi:heat shock protein HtpX|nr:protease HtpX [Gammaproteobacteria bacterium]
MKRIVLFLVTNAAVLVLFSLFMRVTGIDAWLAREGMNYTFLLGFAVVFGMGGAFLSLALSKWTAKRFMGAKVIEQPANAEQRWLVETVRAQAEQAGIGMPEVAIFDSPQLNAFATGMKRDSALVAVSTGLLRSMSREEAGAVLGHEISHVANGDMVTLALLQGVLNTFVIFLSRIVGMLVDRVLLKNERGHGIGFWVATIAAEIVLGLLATMVVMAFSRAREFRADRGGARLAGRGSMIGALQRLKAAHGQPPLPDQLAAFGIAGGIGQGLKRLFMSHPPLDDRIQALRRAGA